MNNQRYIVFAFLALAAVLGAALHGLAVPMVARFEMSDPDILGVLNGTSLAGILFGITVFIVLMRLPKVITFTDEVITELRKVVWPTRDETVRNATIVIGTVAVLSLILGTYDYVWAQITKIFLFTDS
jgi:preprotein translocase subunit SecE